MNASTVHTLDAQVSAATQRLAELDAARPEILVATSTGARGLAESLEGGAALDVGSGLTLHAGELAGRATWIADVAADEADASAPWARALPIWLAAAAGARCVLHTCAGTALVGQEPGAIARVSDHLNLSGRSPLTGLGESRLGPLFPDQTRVHDPELGALARGLGEARGTTMFDAVAACTIGPALATPAEFRWYRSVGADVAVQGLASPLIASAHAGLSGVALCAITDRADEAVDVAALVARSAEVAPALDALVLELVAALPAFEDEDDATP